MKKSSALVFSLLLIVACTEYPPIPDPGDDCPSCKVLLTVNNLVYAAGDTVVVTLRNNGNAPVYLEGCNPLHYAVLADTGWQVMLPRMCLWEGYGIKVDAGTTFTEEYDLNQWKWSGIYKFLATVYFECEDNQPISQAGCSGHELIESLQFAVAPRP